ncbi:MAG TPA: CopG family transcriptional regulator [Gemmataceae bacterium]|nr:CopG family transcriptional regulator [Gemmataceae bacterium]
MNRTRLSVRLDQRTQQRLADEARASGKSESELVREALVAYLVARDREESCLDLARRHDLVGCGKGLPPDLSSSPAHFEGFGK